LYSEAVPKKILELMNVPGLTRENVASHLQVSYCYTVCTLGRTWFKFYTYLIEDPFFHLVFVTEIPVVSSKIEWSFSTPE